ncbi:MAG: DUF5946 family protein [Mycobacteriales bacterium]
MLAADYGSQERMAFHQVVVDAYAAQHPGEDEPRQVQSARLHPMTLCLFLEHGADPSLGTALRRRMVRRPRFRRLQRSDPGGLTVLHVPVNGLATAARSAAHNHGPRSGGQPPVRGLWAILAPHRPAPWHCATFPYGVR